MSDSIKSIITSIIVVATVTTILTRSIERGPGNNTGAAAPMTENVIVTIGQYLRWAVSYATGGQDKPNISERD